MDSKTNKEPASTHRCVDCGAPVEALVGGVAICEDCLATRGACCQEFGSLDLTEDDTPRAYASAPCSAHLFEEVDTVRHDPAARRFETPSGAHLDYRLDDRGMDITHVFVPGELRGKGLAAQLVDAGIEYARQERVTLSASCSYAKAYLSRK